MTYYDGDHEMNLTFANQETATKWGILSKLIKDQSEQLQDYILASGHRYADMNDQQRAFGQAWLQQVTNLRQMGLGLPPSIQTAENNYRALIRGDQI